VAVNLRHMTVGSPPAMGPGSACIDRHNKQRLDVKLRLDLSRYWTRIFSGRKSLRNAMQIVQRLFATFHFSILKLNIVSILE
jgi:hypothetical protein